jgi:hypothetical protein
MSRIHENVLDNTGCEHKFKELNHSLELINDVTFTGITCSNYGCTYNLRFNQPWDQKVEDITMPCIAICEKCNKPRQGVPNPKVVTHI